MNAYRSHYQVQRMQDLSFISTFNLNLLSDDCITKLPSYYCLLVLLILLSTVKFQISIKFHSDKQVGMTDRNTNARLKLITNKNS